MKMPRFLTVSKRCAWRRAIAEVVCSHAWLDAIAPAENGEVLHSRLEIYPPGENQTAMRTCRVCQRIRPNGLLPICCDCQVEQSESTFWDSFWWARDTDHEGLLRRWWPNPARIRDNSVVEIARRVRQAQSCELAMVDSSHSDERSAIYPDETADLPYESTNATRSRPDKHLSTLVAATFSLGISSGRVRFYDAIPAASLAALPEQVAWAILQVAKSLDRLEMQSVRAATTAFRKVCRPIADARILRCRGGIGIKWSGGCRCLIRYQPSLSTRNVSIGTGRSAGCELTLLPESEQALRSEIHQYETFGCVARRARRFTRPNPYHRVPEDHLTVEDLFVSKPRRRAKE